MGCLDCYLIIILTLSNKSSSLSKYFEGVSPNISFSLSLGNVDLQNGQPAISLKIHSFTTSIIVKLGSKIPVKKLKMQSINKYVNLRNRTSPFI